MAGLTNQSDGTATGEATESGTITCVRAAATVNHYQVRHAFPLAISAEAGSNDDINALVVEVAGPIPEPPPLHCFRITPDDYR
jgi:hypothetical protein